MENLYHRLHEWLNIAAKLILPLKFYLHLPRVYKEKKLVVEL